MLGVLLVLVVGVGLVVLTWDNGYTPPSARAGAAATTSATPSAAATGTASGAPSSAPGTTAPASTTIRGTIETVGADRWTVRTKAGLELTVVVTATTTYSGNVDFSRFAVGDTAIVNGELVDGVITAGKVRKGTSN